MAGTFPVGSAVHVLDRGPVRNTVETRPYTAVAVALGLGWFIGRMGGRADY